MTSVPVPQGAAVRSAAPGGRRARDPQCPHRWRSVDPGGRNLGPTGARNLGPIGGSEIGRTAGTALGRFGGRGTGWRGGLQAKAPRADGRR